MSEQKSIEPAWALLVMLKAAKQAGIDYQLAKSIINQPIPELFWNSIKTKQQD